MFSSFSRRQILRLVGLFVAAAATGGLIPLIGFFVSKVQAQEAEDITNYKGNRISIKTKNAARTVGMPYDEPVTLSINDQTVDVIQDKKSAKYQSYYLPFKDYSSVQQLAKDIIDMQALGAGKTKGND